MLAGASLVLSILEMVGLERNLLRCSMMPDSIKDGGCCFIQERSSEKVHWGSKPLDRLMGKLDMEGV